MKKVPDHKQRQYKGEKRDMHPAKVNLKILCEQSHHHFSIQFGHLKLGQENKSHREKNKRNNPAQKSPA